MIREISKRIAAMIDWPHDGMKALIGTNFIGVVLEWYGTAYSTTAAFRHSNGTWTPPDGKKLVEVPNKSKAKLNIQPRVFADVDCDFDGTPFTFNEISSYSSGDFVESRLKWKMNAG